MERRFLSASALESMDFSTNCSLENGTLLSDIKEDIAKLADGSFKTFYSLPCYFTKELAELYLDENDGFHKRQLLRYMDNKNPSEDELINFLFGILFDLTLIVHDDGEIDLKFENHSNFGCESIKVRLVGENVPKLFETLKEFIIKYHGSFKEYKGYTLELDNGQVYREKHLENIPIEFEVENLIRANFCMIDGDLKRILVEHDEIEWYESKDNLDLENRYLIETFSEKYNNCSSDEKLKMIEDIKQFTKNNSLVIGELNLEPQQYLDGWEN